MLPGITRPPVNWLLRAEGLCYGFAAIYVFSGTDISWWIFLALLFIPDISLVAYLAGPRVGGFVYNCFHSTIGPWALLMFGMAAPNDYAYIVGLVWFAHVGIDRALGFGLKYNDSFNHTHLGWIGKRKEP